MLSVSCLNNYFYDIARGGPPICHPHARNIHALGDQMWSVNKHV